jgi:hypothetical protein
MVRVNMNTSESRNVSIPKQDLHQERKEDVWERKVRKGDVSNFHPYSRIM